MTNLIGHQTDKREFICPCYLIIPLYNVEDEPIFQASPLQQFDSHLDQNRARLREIERNLVSTRFLAIINCIAQRLTAATEIHGCSRGDVRNARTAQSLHKADR